MENSATPRRFPQVEKVIHILGNIYWLQQPEYAAATQTLELSKSIAIGESATTHIGSKFLLKRPVENFHP